MVAVHVWQWHTHKHTLIMHEATCTQLQPTIDQSDSALARLLARLAYAARAWSTTSLRKVISLAWSRLLCQHTTAIPFIELPVYSHIHTYIHTYVHTYIHTHTYVQAGACKCVYIYLNTHTKYLQNTHNRFFTVHYKSYSGEIDHVGKLI
jgi:hypothetical protein